MQLSTLPPAVERLLALGRFNRARFDAERWQLRERGFSPSLAQLDPALAPRLAPLAPEDLMVLPEADAAHDTLVARGEDALRRGAVAVVLLNGGMATRFGGVPKGAARALGDRTFLGLRLGQIAAVERALGAKVPVALMSSFATDEATATHLRDTGNYGIAADDLLTFTQNVSLRLTPDGELFLDGSGAPSLYATGHGDLAFALHDSGVGERLRARGVETVFVSNVDNLGCTLDPLLVGAHIASHFVSGAPMTAEIVDRWRDQGGAPAKLDGRPFLLEGFRIPPGFDPSRLVGFNTNTYYFAWEALAPPRPLEFHPVEKSVDGARAIQFERLAGEISLDVDCRFLHVSRDPERGRFLPIKSPEDLESLRPVLTRRYG